jgi:NAD kinase
LTKANVRWDYPATNFLIIHKETDSEFFYERLLELITFLKQRCERLQIPEYRIGVFPKNIDAKSHSSLDSVTFYEYENEVETNYDLVLTLGGDGTVLLAAWLFQDHVPPIVPFHFGTLGFLTVFNWEGFETRLEAILSQGCRFNSRMRLACSIYRSQQDKIAEYSVLNEIVIERGASPYMSILNLYGEDRFLTTIQADGVAIATPTGSTAYSV